MIEPSLATGEMITFKKPFEDTNLDEAGQWIQNLLGDEEWDIGLGRFQDLNELNILSKAEKINVKSFKIRWTERERILQSIQMISFPFLKDLFLNGNCLTTIEPLTMINMPCLQKLNLKENQIRNFDPLRKCDIPCLKEISVYFNNIQRLNSLSQLNSPNLQKIWLNGNKQICQVQSLFWISKLETCRIHSIFVKCESRILTHQQQVWPVLQKKTRRGKMSHQYKMRDDRQINWL